MSVSIVDHDVLRQFFVRCVRAVHFNGVPIVDILPGHQHVDVVALRLTTVLVIDG